MSLNVLGLSTPSSSGTSVAILEHVDVLEFSFERCSVLILPVQKVTQFILLNGMILRRNKRKAVTSKVTQQTINFFFLSGFGFLTRPLSPLKHISYKQRLTDNSSP